VTSASATGHRAPGDLRPTRRRSGNYLCTRIAPVVAGTTFQYPTSAEEIVATVRPTTRGKVVVIGADLDYSLDSSDS
jgi:hypothetical protein